MSTANQEAQKSTTSAEGSSSSTDLLSAAQKRERKARVDLIFCGNHPDVIARHLEEWKEADAALKALEQCLPEDNVKLSGSSDETETNL